MNENHGRNALMRKMKREEGKTYQQVGDAFGVTRQRAWNILNEPQGDKKFIQEKFLTTPDQHLRLAKMARKAHRRVGEFIRWKLGLE